MKSRLLSLAAAMLWILVCADDAMANPFAVGTRISGFEANLHVARDEIQIADADSGIDIHTNRIGIALSEAIDTHLTLGLVGGFLSMSVSGQTLTEGMRLTGNYLGADMRGVALQLNNFRFGYGLRILYQSVGDDINNQNVEMDWAEAAAMLDLSVDISSNLSIHGGSLYTKLDIDQRAQGIVNTTTQFHEDTPAGGIFGITLETDPGGFIDLAVYRGTREGISLTFSRAF